MRTHQRLTGLALVVGCAVVTSGCAFLAGGAVAAGAVVWANNEARTTISSDPETVAKAAESVLTEMSFASVTSVADATKSEVKARRVVDDKDILVKTTLGKAGTVDIAVRVGLVGEKDTSDAILRKIMKRLGV